MFQIKLWLKVLGKLFARFKHCWFTSTGQFCQAMSGGLFWRTSDLIKHIYDFKEVIAHCITKWTVAQDELGCNHSSCYVESFTSDEACQHFMHWPPAAAYLSVGVGQTLTMVSRESSSVGAERG